MAVPHSCFIRDIRWNIFAAADGAGLDFGRNHIRVDSCDSRGGYVIALLLRWGNLMEVERKRGQVNLKIIVEKHADGYVAYPLGVRGVVVGQGDTYEETLADVKSAVAFHVESFGAEVAQGSL